MESPTVATRDSQKTKSASNPNDASVRPQEISPEGATLVYNNTHNEMAVAQAIASFTPKMSRQLWGEVAEFTRSAVSDFAPNHPREAQMFMTAVARLAAWSFDTACLSLERSEVFHGGNIEAYVARGIGSGTPYSNHNARLMLLQVARELGTIDPSRVRDRPTKRPRVMEPYQPAEMARFRSMGESRSTEQRRHNWTVYLCLTAGCGLSTRELLALRRNHITITDAGVRVDVPDAERPHWVVCSSIWERDLRTALESLTTHERVLGRGTQRVNELRGDNVNTLMRAAAQGGPVPVAGRLRATWICQQLTAGTNAITLMHALGMSTLRPLEQYLPHVSIPTTESAAVQLRGEVSA